MSALTRPEMLWLGQALLVALAAGLVLALVVGILLLANPRLLFSLNARLSRWVDTRATFQALDKPHQLERFFYRHHRVLGALVVLGAAFVLARWAFAYDRASAVTLFGRHWLTRGLDWLPSAVEVVVVGLHAVILLVGLVILFRPSLLKAIEEAANHWQPGLETRPLDAVVGNLDDRIGVHPRVSGLVLALMAGGCLVVLAPVLQRILAG